MEKGNRPGTETVGERAADDIGNNGGQSIGENNQKRFTPQKCPRDCIYRGKVNGSTPCCNYIFITDKSRGCQPGQDCKCYRKGVRIHCPEE